MLHKSGIILAICPEVDDDAIRLAPPLLVLVQERGELYAPCTHFGLQCANY